MNSVMLYMKIQQKAIIGVFINFNVEDTDPNWNVQNFDCNYFWLIKTIHWPDAIFSFHNFSDRWLSSSSTFLWLFYNVYICKLSYFTTYLSVETQGLFPKQAGRFYLSCPPVVLTSMLTLASLLIHVLKWGECILKVLPILKQKLRSSTSSPMAATSVETRTEQILIGVQKCSNKFGVTCKHKWYLGVCDLV